MKKHVFKILFFLSLTFSLTAQKSIEKDLVVDSIAVQNSKNETFALYLPKSFDAQTASPIIFVFEPAARGKVGVSSFVDSAEKHGIIIVCSNNSRNGSYEKSFEVAEHLFAHVFANYKINVNKMFLSGFSGGSRLATAIATLTGQFSGVIACGAGFSPNPSHRPSIQKFLYAGICGTTDMNYQEMLTNKEFLSRLGFTNTLVSFHGGHQWPPKSEVSRAVDWLFLQQHQKSGQNITGGSLQNQFLSDYATIVEQENTGELLFAIENYERVLNSYPAHMGLDSIRKRQSMLITSEPYQKEANHFSNALVLEKKTKKKLFGRLESDFKNLKKMNLGWWSKEINKLNLIAEKGPTQTKLMASRVKYGLMAYVYERRYSFPNLSEDQNYLAMVQNFNEILYPK